MIRGTWTAAACVGVLALVAGGSTGSSSSRDVEELARRVTKLETQVNDLQKAMAELRAASRERKDAPATAKEVKAVSDRLDRRTELLAEWMDEYHAQKGNSRYHRAEVSRR